MVRYVLAILVVVVGMLPAYSPTGLGLLGGGSATAEAQRRPVNGACGKADDRRGDVKTHHQLMLGRYGVEGLGHWPLVLELQRLQWRQKRAMLGSS